MKFVCMGFIDEAKFAQVPQEKAQQMMEECFLYDDVLRRGGNFIGGEALGSATKAVSLRMDGGQVLVTDGPFTEAKETLGGILLLEARDRDHAVELMSKHPGVKMGPWEIRPANEEINKLIALRDATIINAATLRTERVMAALPKQVFAAFQNPDCLSKWWGPAGFTNTFETFEFKNGGQWKFVMHGPDGTNYPNEWVFREIMPESKVVIDHVAQPLFTLTVTLAPRGENTQLTWAQKFETVEMAEKLRAICDPANEQNLDRLQAVLNTRSC